MLDSSTNSNMICKYYVIKMMQILPRWRSLWDMDRPWACHRAYRGTVLHQSRQDLHALHRRYVPTAKIQYDNIPYTMCISTSLYWDGWPCLGSIPSAGHLSQYVTSHPGQLSLAIPSQRVPAKGQWVTPCGWGVKAGMVRVWVAGKTVWSHCYTRAISDCFRDKGLIHKALYKFICSLY